MVVAWRLKLQGEMPGGGWDVLVPASANWLTSWPVGLSVSCAHMLPGITPSGGRSLVLAMVLQAKTQVWELVEVGVQEKSSLVKSTP